VSLPLVGLKLPILLARLVFIIWILSASLRRRTQNVVPRVGPHASVRFGGFYRKWWPALIPRRYNAFHKLVFAALSAVSLKDVLATLFQKEANRSAVLKTSRSTSNLRAPPALLPTKSLEFVRNFFL